MISKNEEGFSLIELILVCAMIGVIAAIAIPSLTKSIAAAENASAISTLKIINTAQATIYTQKNRYARLDEINNSQNNKLGTMGTNVLNRGKYAFEMIPAVPTDDNLKSAYLVKASRVVDAAQLPFVLQMDQTGQVAQITP